MKCLVRTLKVMLVAAPVVLATMACRDKQNREDVQRDSAQPKKAQKDPDSDTNVISDGIISTLNLQWDKLQNQRDDEPSASKTSRAFYELLDGSFVEGRTIVSHQTKLSRFWAKGHEAEYSGVCVYVFGGDLYAKVVVVDQPSGRIVRTYYDIHERPTME